MTTHDITITALRAEVERLRAALEKAKSGLHAGVSQYASRDFHGNIIPGDEQYPWVKAMQIGLDAAIAALSGADAPTPWRPIETAPRDGTRMLVAYQTPYKKWRRVVAFYAPKLAIETNIDDDGDWHEYDEANDRYCLPEGWYECIENWDGYSSVHMAGVEPTHWMPIPPPPKKEGE